MNGNEIYENNYINKINNIINQNPDKSYLRGFKNFIENSNSTTYDYINYIISFMNYNKKNVGDLELDDYTEYINSIKEKSASYRISVYSALKKFSLYLEASKKNTDNHMQYVPRPKFTESEETKKKREIGFLTYDEIHMLLDAIDNGVGNNRSKCRQKDWINRDKAIVLLFLCTGMRCSALYKLNVDSINLSDHTLTVIDKGNKYRKFQLSDELLYYIDLWLIDREEFLDGKSEDALFISNRRTRMDQSSISGVVEKYASVIDGKHITPHKLRATYGTQLYAKTGDLYLVQECMGHSNPKTTELYIRGQKNEAAQKASDIMSKIIF